MVRPCLANDLGASQCSSYRLRKDQVRRLKERKVKMADVKRVLRNPVSVASITAVKEIEEFHKVKGKNFAPKAIFCAFTYAHMSSVMIDFWIVAFRSMSIPLSTKRHSVIRSSVGNISELGFCICLVLEEEMAYASGLSGSIVRIGTRGS